MFAPAGEHSDSPVILEGRECLIRALSQGFCGHHPGYREVSLGKNEVYFVCICTCPVQYLCWCAHCRLEIRTIAPSTSKPYRNSFPYRRLIESEVWSRMKTWYKLSLTSRVSPDLNFTKGTESESEYFTTDYSIYKLAGFVTGLIISKQCEIFVLS